MDYNVLLDLATDLGYELAMSGAETFRVEDSIHHVLHSYGVNAEVFAITNYLIVTFNNADGIPITRTKRIGYHGNNLDAVERLNGLSRSICEKNPDPETAMQWLQATLSSVKKYSPSTILLGNFLGAAGFSILFGCGPVDIFFAGICGLIIGLVNQFTGSLKANPFFSTMSAAFLMALTSYTLNVMGLVQNADAVNIGALMILVPGLLFTNALRDIIYGDTNSGINRIVQVILVAMALSLGTAFANRIVCRFWSMPVSSAAIDYPLVFTCIGSFIGCVGFSILFNIHGAGDLLCALGGVAAWAIYAILLQFTGSDLTAIFWGTAFAAGYAEIMARIRKYPAISYLVVSIIPLLPGAGIYYTMLYALDGYMDRFVTQGTQTAATAGTMAVAILLVSTFVRLWTTWRNQQKLKVTA